MSVLPDDDLLRKLQRWYAGEEQALSLVMDEVGPWLRWRLQVEMAGRTVNGHDSDDLTHEVLLNFLRSGPRFTFRSGGQFRALLWRIARNELIDQGRKENVRTGAQRPTLFGSLQCTGSRNEPVVPTSDRPSHIANVGQEWNWLRLALQYVTAEERRLLVASEVEELGWAEIAAELSLPSASAARIRAARLKPRLANLVAKLKAGVLPTS